MGEKYEACRKGLISIFGELNCSLEKLSSSKHILVVCLCVKVGFMVLSSQKCNQTSGVTLKLYRFSTVFREC